LPSEGRFSIPGWGDEHYYPRRRFVEEARQAWPLDDVAAPYREFKVSFLGHLRASTDPARLA
jgi:hypothetical protein